MPVDVRAPYRTRVRQALTDPALRTALDRATEHLAARRVRAMREIDEPRLRDAVRSVREYAVANLPQLLEELERNLIANGCQVHWARDAAEARETVLALAHRQQVRRVVKSKSMVSEEIGLNEALAEAGIRVVETDLGEFIVQLADEPPSHILAPVIHKRIEDISALFEQKLGTRPTDDPAELCATARQTLRNEFLDAEMGVSGCNFAIAETGTICLVTNEGNGRMVSSLSPIYVAIAGIEKVVRSPEDALLLWQAASRSATGQAVSVYMTMSSGPRRPGQADGPEEMHVILLDNGRTRILERGYEEALLCIRCGACLNACPVYREIGGHAYGDTPYNGPIGAVITPLLADDPKRARELPFASSLCGACREVCPAKIDLPKLLLDLRSELVRGGSSPRMESAALRAYAAATGHDRVYGWAIRAFRLFARILARGGESIARLPPPFNIWTRDRDFPKPAPRSFREIWRHREERTAGRGRRHE